MAKQTVAYTHNEILLSLQKGEVAITVGTDNKLKRNLKGKAKSVKISEKTPLEVQMITHTYRFLYMPRAMYKARKMLRTRKSPLHFLWSAIYHPSHGVTIMEMCRSIQSIQTAEQFHC